MSSNLTIRTVTYLSHLKGQIVFCLTLLVPFSSSFSYPLNYEEGRLQFKQACEKLNLFLDIEQSSLSPLDDKNLKIIKNQKTT